MATLSLKTVIDRKITGAPTDVQERATIEALENLACASIPSYKIEHPLSSTQDSKHLRRKMALTWLYETFPDAFFTINQKPLKKGIHQDIFKHLEDMTAIHSSDNNESSFMLPSKRSIREVFNYYINNVYYQQGLINCAQRIDLFGNPVEEISALEKEHATALYYKKNDGIKKALRLKRKKYFDEAVANQEPSMLPMPTDSGFTLTDG